VNPMTTRVLHLGWNPVNAVEALCRHGAEVTCAVVPADLAAARESPYTIAVVPVADPASAEQVLTGLGRAGRYLDDFDVVSPAGEMELIAASLLGALAGAPGVPPRVMTGLRDKFVQKARTRAAGVPVADCQVLESLDESALTTLGGGPMVIKPLDGAGAQDTFVIAGADQLAGLRIGAVPPALWLAERYIDGREFHFDGVVRKGELLDLAVSRFLTNVIGIKEGVEMASVGLRPTHFPQLYEDVSALAEKVFAALGYIDGTFHGEGFVTADGSLVLGEIGGRIGGGGISVASRRVRGVDLHDEWARTILGLPSALPLTERPPERAYGWINLKGRAGRVIAAPTVGELAAQPGVVHAEMKIGPGDLAPDISVNSSVRVGRAVVIGDDEDQAEARLRAVSAWVTERMIVQEHS
jgi:hypothetical protein